MDHFNSSDYDSHVETLIKEWHVPGVAIAFYQNGKTSSKAFGVASIASGKPCTPDSLFDIASSSKSFTSAAVGILVHDRETHPDIEWVTPMRKLLPEDFVMSKPEYTQDVTVEDILSHRTGLPRHDSSYFSQSALQPDTAASVTRGLRNLSITAPIRSKWQYCNLLYTVATHLVETYSKMTFSEFLHHHIFAPLGMNSTHLFHSAATAAGLKDRLTSPHSYNQERDELSVIPWAIDPEAQGAGSICTSVNDMILYIAALINRTSPLSHDLVRDLTTPRILIGTPSDKLDPFTSYPAYALGWEITFYRGHEIVQHDGGIPGYNSRCFFLPALQAGGVILGNGGGGADNVCDVLSRELIDSVIGVPESERIDWRTWVRDNADAYRREQAHDKTELRKSLLEEGQTEPEALTVPLETYAGIYYNPGYHSLRVEVRDGNLFVDARDRSMGFTLTLEHIRAGRFFVANLVDRDDPEDTDELKTEFELHKGKDGQVRAVRMGVDFEPEMDDCIWFDRVA